ncbi:MFS transporter [Escherichia coli]|nr:MFS transporter [Escherichia coli]
MSTRTPSSSSSRLMLTIGLCFLVALMEGLDLQAAGIAAGGIAQAFALDKMQMGWIFSAGILGLLPGALVGGMLADRYGRKRILIGSVALFGLFSLATAIAWDFPSLVFARLMTGVGLGAALPNLIALTSEAAGPRFRGTAVSLMYCGVPIGAALAATLGFAGANLAWQTVFWVGGVVPLFYSSQIRATGVGTAVAVGRLGAMSGPLLAGKMLALGTGTVGVIAASAPGILVAGLAVFILMSRRSRMQPCADA